MCALLIVDFFAGGRAGNGVADPCSSDDVVTLVDVVPAFAVVLLCCANPAVASISTKATTASTPTRLLISLPPELELRGPNPPQQLSHEILMQQIPKKALIKLH